jgi:hypothetical protein
MSEDKKLILLKTKQKEDSSVEDMVDDCVQLLADKKFSHGVTILFDEQTSDLNILATTNLMKNSRDLIGMLEEVKLFLFRNNYE